MIINNYILGLLWGSQSFFLFDSYSKDEIGRIFATVREKCTENAKSTIQNAFKSERKKKASLKKNIIKDQKKMQGVKVKY